MTEEGPGGLLLAPQLGAGLPQPCSPRAYSHLSGHGGSSPPEAVGPGETPQEAQEGAQTRQSPESAGNPAPHPLPSLAARLSPA